MHIDGIEYRLLLGKQGSQYYCQFQHQDKQTIQETELRKELHTLLPKTSKDQQYGIWKWCNDYFDTLILFEQVIEILLPKVDKQS